MKRPWTETEESENDEIRSVKKMEETPLETRVVAALVLTTTLETFDELKREAVRLGCEIVFQRVAPRFKRLWIVERDARDEP